MLFCKLKHKTKKLLLQLLVLQYIHDSVKAVIVAIRTSQKQKKTNNNPVLQTAQSLELLGLSSHWYQKQ